ncbi:hypothetical protein N3K63_11675 [Microbacterium sp. W1N]|uniref:hypothetical protein n=1 Tax=Microbacterium festucae TaxID=2977531 RepID=UPI0021BE48A1|nr:hypothetical protein [Microbacterium festucae]MCT9820941.1 hypothetical protein [Microbacterium festucae]
MASSDKHHDETPLRGGVLSGDGSPAMWGTLLGLIVFAFVAVPISAAVRFATHPLSQQLFGGRLEEATTGGYVTFWWIVALGLLATPVLVGWGVAKMSKSTLAAIAVIVGVFFLAVVILGQLFVF